jgi:hypothetical protein
MNQKKNLALGIIVTFVFLATITLRPVEARDDEDYLTQTGSLPININPVVDVETVIQLAFNTAIVGPGDDNTATAESGQTAGSTESNDPSDNNLSEDRTNNFDPPSLP